MDAASEVYKAILSGLNNIPPDAWEFISEAVVSALAVSVVGQWFKRWITSPQGRMWLVIMLSFLPPVYFYLKGVPQFAPWIIPVQASMIFLISQPFYRHLTKTLGRRIVNWLLLGTDKVRLRVGPAADPDLVTAADPLHPVTVPVPSAAVIEASKPLTHEFEN
jgi:hypothetical protein